MTLILPEWLMWFFAAWIVVRIISNSLQIYGYYLDAEFKMKINELPDIQREALEKLKAKAEGKS